MYHCPLFVWHIITLLIHVLVMLKDKQGHTALASVAQLARPHTAKVAGLIPGT